MFAWATERCVNSLARCSILIGRKSDPGARRPQAGFSRLAPVLAWTKL